MSDFEKTICPPREGVDQSAAIEERLKQYGICRLEKGEYLVSAIHMPAYSTLEGIGDGTVLKALPRETKTGAHSIIDMAAGCTVTALSLIGSDNEIFDNVDENFPEVFHTGFEFDTFSPAKMERENPTNGIRVAIEEDNHIHAQLCRINRVTVFGFSGAGILVEKTGFFALRSVAISDVQVSFNGAGIMTGELGEFGIISNITATMNHFGILNNGGNNKFNGCGVDGNMYGFVIEAGTNNAHGCIVGSSFNHNAHGAIRISDTGSGFIIADSHIGHSGTPEEPTVDISNASDILFTGCKFLGRSRNPLQIRIRAAGEKVRHGANFIGNTFFVEPIWLVDESIAFPFANNYNRHGEPMTLNR